MPGIGSRLIDEVPLAVVDVETTGLHPNGDRIVEIAVARVEPGGKPRIVLDTLVNPGRRVSATEIHGITDRDVRDAPTFDEVAPQVASTLEGAVFAAYNVYFDAKFVGTELQRAGFDEFPPYLCLMYMRPMLDLGARCTLDDACRQHSVPFSTAHLAADDALVSGELWLRYLDVIHHLGIQTFGDLAKRKKYKFTESFSVAPLSEVAGAKSPPRLKSRRSPKKAQSRPPSTVPIEDRRREYWEALKSALSDKVISGPEVKYLREKGKVLGLPVEEVRSLHARAFAGMLARFSDDRLITDEEVKRMAQIGEAMGALGWKPGDHLQSAGSHRSFFSRVFGG